jgi:hypothetical protein
MYSNLDYLYSITVDEYLKKHLFENPRYLQKNKLNRYEFQAYSQHGEDGLIEEIFNRIGTTNKYFVEVGVQDGNECNSAYLLFKGWTGLWIEGNDLHVKSINESCKGLVATDKLTVLNAFVNAENIEGLLERANAPASPDLLSIDIDRNDYYVWEAIRKFTPRVVAIEYNSIFKPSTRFVVAYDPKASWDGTSNYGASLQSLYELGCEKGYKLVGCDFTGTNAFFVSEDLTQNFFDGPFTAEEHYEPTRYFLTKKEGHPRKLNF